MINIPIKIGISGEYRLIINRADGTKYDTGWFKNLILDQGLDRIGTVNPSDFKNLVKFVKVGTGTTPPEVSQTALETQIAEQQSLSTTKTNLGSPNYIGRCQVRYTFGLGEILDTITEIGVGWTSSTGNLFSRALITPGLTLGSLDQLDVYYKLDFTPSLTDVNGSFTVGSTVHNYTIRRAEIDQYAPGDDTTLISGRNSSLAIYESFVLGNITDSPTGTLKATDTSPIITTYIPNSYYIETRFDFGVAITISSGSGGLLYRVSSAGFDSGAFQISYTPPITKTTNQLLIFVMRNSWARL